MAPFLTARRAVDRQEWERTFEAWQEAAEGALEGHPWEKLSSVHQIDELRGGPVDLVQPAQDK